MPWSFRFSQGGFSWFPTIQVNGFTGSRKKMLFLPRGLKQSVPKNWHTQSDTMVIWEVDQAGQVTHGHLGARNIDQTLREKHVFGLRRNCALFPC